MEIAQCCRDGGDAEQMCLVEAAEAFLIGYPGCTPEDDPDDPLSDPEPEPPGPVVITTCGEIPVDD